MNTFGVGWLPKYPADIVSAHAGEVLPIPKIPAGTPFKAGDRSPFAGKADFYRMRYGPYLIGMNTTKDKTFDLGVNAKTSAKDLVSGKTLALSTPLPVKPMTTVILDLKNYKGDITMKPFKAASTLAALAVTAATTPVIAKADVPAPLFSENFNAPNSNIELVNGAKLGAGVSGKPEDKAYVADVQIGAAPPGPGANLKPLQVGGNREGTITVWYKAGATQVPTPTLFSLGGMALLPPKDDINGGWTLRVEAERPQGKMYWFNSGDKGAYLPYSTPDQWQFLAASWNGNTHEVSFYQGTSTQVVKLGKTQKNDAATGGLIQGKDTKWSEVIGSNMQKYARSFNGSIDNVRYFSKALDAGQLETIRVADLKNETPGATASTPAATTTASTPASSAALFSENFNGALNQIELKNGAKIGDDASGVSGLAGDKSYVAIPDMNNAAGGPVATFKQRVATAGLDEATTTFWYLPDANQLPNVMPLDVSGLALIGDKADEWTLRVNAKVEAGKMYWFYSGKSTPAWRAPGEWQFIALTWKRNSSEVVFYQAGKTGALKEARRQKSNLSPETGLLARSGNSPDALGNTANTKYDRPFFGAVDNVRIYGKGLDAAAIEAIRQADLKNTAPAF